MRTLGKSPASEPKVIMILLFATAASSKADPTASVNSSGPSLVAQTFPTLIPDQEAQACSNFDKGCTSVEAVVGSKATLPCCIVPLENLIMVSWTITCNGTANWTMAYRNDTAYITTPPDVRLAWGPRPDLNPALQIEPVTITDDNFYRCDIATSQGNFNCGLCLSVLVPPTVSLVVGKDNQVVCEASAGKPAAQISWVPPGEHSTSSRTHGNGTVTVVSTYWGNSSYMSDLVCSVSHVTGNRSLSMYGTSGLGPSQLLPVLLSLSGLLAVLIIGGALGRQKLRGCCRTPPTVIHEASFGAKKGLTGASSQNQEEKEEEEEVEHIYLNTSVESSAHRRAWTQASSRDQEEEVEHNYFNTGAESSARGNAWTEVFCQGEEHIYLNFK
ncbi:cell surface glycoprotein CD200 receptor 5-like isoform X2 [Ornithorhynchus anatinus]|uniref:Ig-like domain-containing protein n=1 Tax=Ornithorhynchus anatinus TaxID=9258 RepID=A0A6I8N6T7_ORNAN|nr:cell surface glycoprotein CD200 receptor 5-like isoform X2 [Ornithorhynchus anatinus]